MIVKCGSLHVVKWFKDNPRSMLKPSTETLHGFELLRGGGKIGHETKDLVKSARVRTIMKLF